MLKWVTREGVIMLLLKSFPKLHYLHIHFGLGRMQACLKAKKVDQPILRGPSCILHILFLQVSKMNRIFQWISKDSRPDLVTLKDAWHDSCRICFETGIRNLVILAVTQTLLALHSFLDALGSKNASWWLLGNYCWTHARGINCVNIFKNGGKMFKIGHCRT